MTALSIVVPCFNEEECLTLLHGRLTGAARTSFGEDYEIILVNDGSKDRTWPIMQELSAADPHLTCVNLSRNHGHQLALTAGLDLARGQRILVKSGIARAVGERSRQRVALAEVVIPTQRIASK